MSNEVAFANWWEKEMKGIPCPPVPRNLSELTMTAQMAMQATHPQLYTALFAGSKEVRLPADVSVRLQSGQLLPGDAGFALVANCLYGLGYLVDCLIEVDQRISSSPLT